MCACVFVYLSFLCVCVLVFLCIFVYVFCMCILVYLCACVLVHFRICVVCICVVVYFVQLQHIYSTLPPVDVLRKCDDCQSAFSMIYTFAIEVGSVLTSF